MEYHKNQVALKLVDKKVADKEEIAIFLTSVIRGEIKSQRIERIFDAEKKIKVPKVVEYIDRETQISACKELSKIMGYELKVRKEIDAIDVEYTDVKFVFENQLMDGVKDI